MPLSEHEERILAEIERQLAAEDPRFASSPRRTLVPLSAWSRSLRLRLAIVMGVIGIVAVPLGLSRAFPVAIVGMALLFTAIVLGATAVRERVVPQDQPVGSPQDDNP